jgi:hypothetical protein
VRSVWHASRVFIPAELWPQLVMLREGDFLSQCKFEAFQAAAVQACDQVGDRVGDSVIGEYEQLFVKPNGASATSTGPAPGVGARVRSTAMNTTGPPGREGDPTPGAVDSASATRPLPPIDLLAPTRHRPRGRLVVCP